MKHMYDIIIVGGGMIGLTLAAALARADFKILIVETKKPLFAEKNSLDARVSAVHQVGYRILKNLNAWSALPEETYSPLREMQVWDSTGGGVIHFNCADVGASELGYIVENQAIVQVLWQQLQEHDRIHFILEKKPIRIAKTLEDVSLTLSDQSTYSAKLIIGADGGHSWVREQISAGLVQRSYQQEAIIAVVQMEKPHEFTAYQNFLPNGPLGLLPLHNPHQAVIVWSTKVMHAEQLAQLTDDEFNLELTKALEQKLGKIQLLSERKHVPLMMRHARCYVSERIALVGDAAHMIHPLAGQGANLGFMDAACLAECLIVASKKNSDIGQLKTLRKYERWRKADNITMLAAMQAFHECFTEASSPVVHLRSFGLNFANRHASLKNMFMRYAMGEHGDLPLLAKPQSPGSPH